MLKILINNEEVVCDKQLEIKEEMLATSSCILNNCYPKSWENTKDYTSQYYYPKDYSKCLIYDNREEQTLIENGTILTFDNLTNPKIKNFKMLGETYQDGTPTPDNPIEVQTITGEQIIQVTTNNIPKNYQLSLGSIELCKIADCQDYIYKQNGNWYIHKEITKHIFDGNDDDGYNFNADLSSVTAVNLTPNKVDQAAIQKTSQYNIYCDKFQYLANIGNTEHIYITAATQISGGYYGNIRVYVSHDRLDGYSSSLSNSQKRQLVVNWLQNNPITTYYIARYPNEDTQITNSTLISQLESIALAKGNNIMSTEVNTLPFNLDIEVYDSGVDLLFSGVIKNTGNISLNPRQPHYCNLEVLDFKTFLSECDQLDFVINNKTITEAIEQVTEAVSSYGFVVGNVNINDNTIIGAYSTQEKTPYDVFQYLADISQSRWFTRLVDENTVAIDFYDPEEMERGIDLDFSNNEFACQNNVENLTFNYGTYDYRNKQIMLSDQVFGGVDFEETIIADGYAKTFNTMSNIGILLSIYVDGVEKSYATQDEKQIGLEADFYYTPGSNTLESNENDGTYTAGSEIKITYTPLIKGRQVVTNTDEINRINLQTGRNGVIARYESRNDVLSNNELNLVGQSYIKYKGTPEINLTLVTKDYDLYNIGQIVYFNYPNIEELSQDYMVKSKKTRIINTATDWNIWYTYTLTSNFNSETAINYFDNQRAKASGNIQSGDYITRNIDIENSATIIFSNATATEITITDNNILNAPLNAPFTQ